MARRNGSGPKDVTVEILKQIRDEMRGMRAEQEQTNTVLARAVRATPRKARKAGGLT